MNVGHIPWAPGKWQRSTKALAAAIATLAQQLAWLETAMHFGVDWKTVASVVRRAVEWGLTHRRWAPLHVIGIDEVSRANGQRYVTFVYDLARGQLVWAGENRDAPTMAQFFAWLGPRRKRALQLVCATCGRGISTRCGRRCRRRACCSTAFTWCST